MGRDQRVVHVARMARRIAQAREARDLGEALDEARERPHAPVRPVAVIGVDVLPDERDLAHPGVGEALGLGDDLGGRPRDLGAAGVGHDAKGAELVAAFLDRQEGGCAAAAHRREMVELVLDREFGVDDPALRGSAGDERGQAVIALRADDHVDHRRAADDLPAFGLGDAARDDDLRRATLRRPGALRLPHPAKLGIDLLGRLLADMAGVEDDDVGLRHVGRLGEALGRENVRHALGVVDVHLAAVGFDEKLLHQFSPVDRRAAAPLSQNPI